MEARGITRVEWSELARWVGLDDPVGRVGTKVERNIWVRAEREAIDDGASATRVGEDAGIDSEDVGHGEEGGGAGSELGGEGSVAVGELEALADSAGGYEGVEPSRERWLVVWCEFGWHG